MKFVRFLVVAALGAATTASVLVATPPANAAAPRPTTTHLSGGGGRSGGVSATAHPGQVVKFTAHVAGATYKATNGGIVDIFDAASEALASYGCSGLDLNPQLVATCNVTWSKLGTYYVKADYRDDWGPDADSTSSMVTVHVVKWATSVTAKASKTSVTRGSVVTFTGKVSPARQGSVALQEQIGSTWKTITSAKIAARGFYTVRSKVTATHAWRVHVAADATHRAGTSKTIKVAVH